MHIFRSRLDEVMRAGLLALAFAVLAPAVQAEPASWAATSKTAMAITGNIVVDDSRLTFANGTGLDLKPYEMAREGDWSSDGSQIAGDVFKIDPPQNPKLLQGNSLCDGPASYVVLWTPDEGELTINVYSGDAAPTGNDKVDRSCATYSYEAE